VRIESHIPVVATNDIRPLCLGRRIVWVSELRLLDPSEDHHTNSILQQEMKFKQLLVSKILYGIFDVKNYLKNTLFKYRSSHQKSRIIFFILEEKQKQTLYGWAIRERLNLSRSAPPCDAARTPSSPGGCNSLISNSQIYKKLGNVKTYLGALCIGPSILGQRISKPFLLFSRRLRLNLAPFAFAFAFA
jgi:hypothetical protein